MRYVACLKGPKISTCRQFGPDGAIKAMLFCLVATVIIILLLKKQNKILKPYWK